MKKILTLVLAVSLLLSMCSFGAMSVSADTDAYTSPIAVNVNTIFAYGSGVAGNDNDTNITSSYAHENYMMLGLNNKIRYLRFDSIDFGENGADSITINTTNKGYAVAANKAIGIYSLPSDTADINKTIDVWTNNTTNLEYMSYANAGFGFAFGTDTTLISQTTLVNTDNTTIEENSYGGYSVTFSLNKNDYRGVRDIIICCNGSVGAVGNIVFTEAIAVPVNPYTTISVDTYSEFGSNKATNDSGASSAITSGLAKFNNPNLRWLRFDNLDFGDVGAKSITLNLDTANTAISNANHVFTIFAFDHTNSLVNRTYTPWSNDASIYIDSAGTGNVGGVKVGDTVYTNIKKYTYGTTTVGSTITIDFDSPVTGTKDIIFYTNSKPALTGFYFTPVPTSTPVADFNFISPDEYHMTKKGAPQWGWGTTSDIEQAEVGDYLLYKKVDFGNGSKLYNVQIGYNREFAQPCVVKVYIDNNLAGSMDIVNTGVWGSATNTPSYLGTIIKTEGVHDVKFVFEGVGCDVQDLKFSEVTTQIGDLNEKSVTFTLNNAESATVRLILAKYDTVDDRLNEVILEDVKVDSSTFSKTLTLTENKSTDETVKAFIWRTDIMPLTVCREY